MFSRFLLCSGFAALVNLACGQLLYGVLGWNGTVGYPVSVGLAFFAGMIVSYVLNRRHTYAPSGRSRRSEMISFAVVSLGGVALTTGLAQLLVIAFRHPGALSLPIAPESAAHIAAVGITAFYSFFAHKFVSFRRASADGWART